MLKHFCETNSGKLMKMTFPDIPNIINIKILWFSSIPFHENAEQIMHNTHCHSFYEAHFVIKGAFEFKADEGQVYILSAEEGIVFAPQTKHCIKDSVSDSIRFTLAFQAEKGNELDSLLSQKNYYRFPVDLRIIDCIDIILYEIAQQNTFSSAIIQNRLFEIICEMIRAVGIDDHFKNKHNMNSENLIILKAKQYISDNKDRLLNCSEVAEYCHYNTKYLSRIFAKQTGHTLLEYIHHEKIIYAEELLKDESLTLKQVSDALGFANEYYFNRFFKQKNGIAPGKYRKYIKI